MSAMSERIRALRIERKMSQKELAELAGVHPAAVSFLERGVRPRSYEVVKKVAPALGISNVEIAEYLLETEPA